MYTLGRGKYFGSYEPRVDVRVDPKLKTWRWRKTAEGWVSVSPHADLEVTL